MSAFFDTHGVPTVVGLKKMFDSLDETRTDREWRTRQAQLDALPDPPTKRKKTRTREVEIQAKRLVERAVRTSNHVLRHIHKTTNDGRGAYELGYAARLLEDARRLLTDGSKT